MISDHNIDLKLIEVLGVNPQWIALVEDESVRVILNQLAVNSAMPPACVQLSDASTTHAILNSGIQPQVLIFDFVKSSDVVSDARAVVNICPQDTRVIVIGSDDHIATFRGLKRIGVADYLVMPIVESALQESINDVLSMHLTLESQNPALKLKPFTVVIGARGGVGASTLCVNLAWLSAVENHKKVCVVDFDLYHGTICILLDLIQNAGLNDALTETERLDELFLKRLLLQKEENLSVLTGQLSLEQDVDFSVEAIKSLVALLRAKYDIIYADLPPSFNTAFSQAVLMMADNAIIVTDLSLVSVQGVLRLKSYLATHVPHLKYKIIANNIFPAGGTVGKAMFEKAISSQIEEMLPYCKDNMLEGMNAGDPLVKTRPKHQYSNSLRKIISLIYPQVKPEKEKKSSILSKWWGSKA